LGAFIAGMMLGETEYRHQIKSDIRPFRDVLLGLFFITVGMGLSFQFFLSHASQVLLLLAGIVLLKMLLIILIMKALKKPLGVSARTAISLGQVGEFGLVLLTLAAGYQLFDETLLKIVMTTVVLSMMIAPLLIKYNGRLVKALDRSYNQEQQHREDEIREETDWIKKSCHSLRLRTCRPDGCTLFKRS